MQQKPKDFGDVEEEAMICPACHAQNSADATFCFRCDAPLGAMAVYGPLEQVRAQRFIFHRAATGPSSVFIVVSMWAICIPIIVLPVPLIWTMIFYRFASLHLLLLSFVQLLFSGLAACLLFRVTANYRIKRSEQKNRENA